MSIAAFTPLRTLASLSLIVIACSCSGTPDGDGILGTSGSGGATTSGSGGATTGGSGGATTGGSGGATTGGSGGATTGGSGGATTGGSGGATTSGSGGVTSQGGAAQGGAAQGGAAQGGAAQGGAAQGGAAQGGAGPQFIGRFDMTDPKAPVFDWSGAAIALRFKGTSIAVTLTDGTRNVFEVIVDGKHTVVPMTGGTMKYPLASGLIDGPHDVVVYRRTEASQGDTTFRGFDVAPSAYLPNDSAPSHRLEVIGDSISAGYGDEGSYPCSFTPATENHYLTYGAVAARSVGAELYTEAWSGIGMVQNNDGSTAGTMPDRYGRTLPLTDTADTWDFSKFVPDAVVINLGTNDFNGGDPGMKFQVAYTKFVTRLRGYYPKARLYLAVGPMLTGASYTGVKQYLNGVIATRAQAQDTNLALLDFGTQGTPVGCDYHPTVATHQKMADTLVAALKADLGF